jgi:hypothetical protein
MEGFIGEVSRFKQQVVQSIVIRMKIDFVNPACEATFVPRMLLLAVTVYERDFSKS